MYTHLLGTIHQYSEGGRCLKPGTSNNQAKITLEKFYEKAFQLVYDKYLSQGCNNFDSIYKARMTEIIQ